MGFKKAFRTYRYWIIDPTILGGENFIEKNYDYKLEYGDKTKNYLNNNPTEFSSKSPNVIFSIKTSSGYYETDFKTPSDLRDKLKVRFPSMSDDAITKIMANNSNYKMVEKRVNYGKIIESVIDEYLTNEIVNGNNQGDSVDITPNMNLGLGSPFEQEI